MHIYVVDMVSVEGIKAYGSRHATVVKGYLCPIVTVPPYANESPIGYLPYVEIVEGN